MDPKINKYHQNCQSVLKDNCWLAEELQEILDKSRKYQIEKKFEKPAAKKKAPTKKKKKEEEVEEIPEDSVEEDPEEEEDDDTPEEDEAIEIDNDDKFWIS